MDAMELSVPDVIGETLNTVETAALAKEYGIELWSFHLPFSKRYIISHVEWDIPGAIALNSEMIKRWAAVGIDKFVIHPSPDNFGGTHDSRLAPAKESLAVLAEVASQAGATLCVEVLPRTCLGKDSDEILELVSVHPQLGVCFDTNHLLGEDFETFINKVGKRIVTTHISDYDFVDERHWLPGEGKVDWQKLYSMLSALSYNGAWMYELGYIAPPTLKRSRPLYALDFVRNAEAIFGATEIPRVG
jgi:sugar phosphate isomerase/epimerase